MSQTINSIVFVDSSDGAALQYDGPFQATRDGGSFEVTIPVDPDDYAGIGEVTAENLSERVGDFIIARADGDIESSGVLDAADILDETLQLRIDDAQHLSPSEIDVDRSELDV